MQAIIALLVLALLVVVVWVGIVDPALDNLRATTEQLRNATTY